MITCPGFENRANDITKFILESLYRTTQLGNSEEISPLPGFESPVRLDLSLYKSLERSKEGKKATKKKLKDSRKTIGRGCHLKQVVELQIPVRE